MEFPIFNVFFVRHPRLAQTNYRPNLLQLSRAFESHTEFLISDSSIIPN